MAAQPRGHAGTSSSMHSTPPVLSACHNAIAPRSCSFSDTAAEQAQRAPSPTRDLIDSLLGEVVTEHMAATPEEPPLPPHSSQALMDRLSSNISPRYVRAQLM